MRFAIITLAAALSATAVVPAQAQEAPQRRPQVRAERMDSKQHIERRVQMLTERLDLSADQAARVKTLLTREGEQLKALFQKREGKRAEDEQARAAFRSELQKVREQTNSEIAKVLNADQLKKYDELKQQRQRAHARRGRPAQRT